MNVLTSQDAAVIMAVAFGSYVWDLCDAWIIEYLTVVNFNFTEISVKNKLRKISVNK